MKAVHTMPRSMTEKTTHYCPGCVHGIVHRIVADVIDDLDVQDRVVGVAAVGCSILAYEYFDVDFQEAAHGRAPALATGIKRVHPDSVVFTYQGDGDLASIGAAEIIHAAMRGENITVIFVNNAIYGMTGGQMAPTTLSGQKSTTSPGGRDPGHSGHPIRVVEMLATLPGAVYLERVSCHDARHIMRTRKAIQKAFEVQLAGEGFALVEVLSNCPTNWRMDPKQSLEWLKDNMIPYFPLGELRTPGEAD